MKATLEWLLGVGGAALDPVNGAALFLRKAAALSSDLFVPAALNYTDAPSIATNLKTLPPDVVIILCGDSAGCMACTQVAQAIYPRKIAYIALVQSSNLMPTVPIGDNVAVVDSFYNDWWMSFPPSMGNYKPQLAGPPDIPDLVYPGDYIGNQGKTLIRYNYAPHWHPADDDPSTQNTILAQVKTVLANL